MMFNILNILNKVQFDGTLEIIDHKNQKHIFGNSNPLVTIRLISKSLERKLFLNPSLYIGEAYMNKELIAVSYTHLTLPTKRIV